MKWLDKKEYPFKGRFLELSMGKMHYLDEGHGEPIIMVHGNPGWSFEFRNIVKVLSKTHRCIVPDHIGFGLSEKPYSWTYLPRQHADNFEKLINSLSLGIITLVVNDWGGPIGLSYAIKYPEKIKKIVILNSWMWSVKSDWYYQGFSGFMGGAIGRYLIKHYNIFGKSVVKKAVGDSKKLTKYIHRHYYNHLETPQDRKGCYTFPKQIIGSSEWLDELWKKKENINTIPTTLIWGMKDIAFREKELKKWIEHWVNPKVIKLDNVGHFPQEEEPETLIKELLE